MCNSQLLSSLLLFFPEVKNRGKRDDLAEFSVLNPFSMEKVINKKTFFEFVKFYIFFPHLH